MIWVEGAAASSLLGHVTRTVKGGVNGALCSGQGRGRDAGTGGQRKEFSPDRGRGDSRRAPELFGE